MYSYESSREAGTLQSFSYTAEQLQVLEGTLSTERLAPYRALAGGDLRRAIALYERNTALSESLYGVLQGLEVTLRNAIDHALATGLGQPDWYDSGVLQAEQLRPLGQAKAALAREGKPLASGRIVAELPFGFWTGVTGPGYADLWRIHLVKAFPRRPLQRKDAHDRLNTIRKLRNRIAHYEPILSRPLQKDFNQILDAIAWICPVTARWVRAQSTFPERFRAPIGARP